MNNLLSENLTVNAENLIPQTESIFSEEELGNISGLCSVLQRIRNRLISEGYSIDELRKKLLENAVSKMV